MENVYPSINFAMAVNLRSRLLVAARNNQALSETHVFDHGGNESADAAAAVGAHGFIYDMHLQGVDDAAHAHLCAYRIDCFLCSAIYQGPDVP